MTDDIPALRLPDPRMISLPQPNSWFAASTEDGPDARHGPGDNDPMPAQAADGVFVRPFIMTLGRTRPLHDGLRIETLVLASPAAMVAPLRFEQRRIVELCQHPMSVAELAANLRVPLGVARVLIADLYAANHVLLREPTELPVRVIERIRDLVRAL